jgi:hypothetical protein
MSDSSAVTAMDADAPGDVSEAAPLDTPALDGGGGGVGVGTGSAAGGDVDMDDSVADTRLVDRRAPEAGPCAQGAVPVAPQARLLSEGAPTGTPKRKKKRRPAAAAAVAAVAGGTG